MGVEISGHLPLGCSCAASRKESHSERIVAVMFALQSRYVGFEIRHTCRRIWPKNAIIGRHKPHTPLCDKKYCKKMGMCKGWSVYSAATKLKPPRQQRIGDVHGTTRHHEYKPHANMGAIGQGKPGTTHISPRKRAHHLSTVVGIGTASPCSWPHALRCSQSPSKHGCHPSATCGDTSTSDGALGVPEAPPAERESPNAAGGTKSETKQP